MNNLNLTEKEKEFLKQYASVFESERKIDCTSDPIVIVEDLSTIVTQEGFEDKYVYVLDDFEAENEDELIELLRSEDFGEEEINEIIYSLDTTGEAFDNEISLYPVKEIYKPIAYFLTRKEAEDYCKYQSHNLKQPRVYTRNMGYANQGDLKVLTDMLLRIGRELNKERNYE